MARAVRFNEYGDESVLYLADIHVPSPGDGEVVVRVRTAGVSTGEVGIRSGAMDSIAPAHFPEGEGTEFAGVVDTVGGSVDSVSAGDRVIGITDDRSSQADYVRVAAKNLIPKPDELDWDTAAAVPAAAATATSIVNTLKPERGETVVVAGASGSVGVVVVQLMVRAGVRVIATASDRNHPFLASLGTEPVAYGDGLAHRIRQLAPNGVDAFADCHGGGNLDVAQELDVAVGRMNTIKDFETAKRIGANANGMYQLEDIIGSVKSVTGLVASGEIVIPVKATFPLEQVQDAYRRLTEPGGVGKIVLEVSRDGD